MKMQRINWYGLDHTKINERFEGGLTFINSFCVLGEYDPVAVYKVKNPDRSKGHKDFLLLTIRHIPFNQLPDEKQLLIRGMTKQEINKEKFQMAIHCPDCDEVVFSVMRHDYRKCSCGKTGIDGGKDYSRTNRPGNLLTLNLLSGRITELGKKYGEKHENKKLSKV